LGGANLTGATVAGADFLAAELASARLVAPIGLGSAKNFDKAQNIERLLREWDARLRPIDRVKERGAKFAAASTAVFASPYLVRAQEQVVVLQAGRVCEDGPPQVLVRSKGVYGNLVRREVARLAKQAA
jgi:hypothetical protein